MTIWAGWAYIGPRHKVVGSFSESFHNGVLHDFIWDIEVVGVLDEGPAWFASARVPADCDVGIEVRYHPIPSILGLDRDSLEEKVHRGHETLLGARATVLYQAFPVAMLDRGQFVVQDRKNDEESTHSRVRVETRVLLS